MTEKRFITIESGIDFGVIDNTTDERIFDIDITAKLNELSEENEQLKKELFEAKKDYLIETSDEVDKALYVEKEIEKLRKEIFE